MARAQKTRSSGLTAVMVRTAKTGDQGKVLGFVEQFSVTQSLRHELVYAVGSQTAVENVLHGVDRVDISWGLTKTLATDDMAAIGCSPMDVELSSFEPIDVVYVDLDRGTEICSVRDVLPSSVGVSTGAMAKLTENWSGSGIQVKWASELELE